MSEQIQSIEVEYGADWSEDVATRMERIRKLARLLDESFRIPGINYRIGLDGLIGLIPGLGDLITTVCSLYIISEAAKLGVPKRLLALMTAYVLVDLLGGSIPIVGDVFDVTWKANTRNVELLDRHFRSQQSR